MPVVSTLMGLGVFPASHRQFLGLTGMHGHKPSNLAVHKADLVIAAGVRFSDRVTGDRSQYADGKRVIHIEIDPAEIDKNVTADIALIGDLKASLEGLIKEIESGRGTDRAQWWATIDAWRTSAIMAAPGAGSGVGAAACSGESRLSGPWLMRHMAAAGAGRPIIYVTDVGQHQMWAAQHLAPEEPRCWLTSGGLGTMGFGLPAGIGAQLARPDRRVVVIAGDGGFKMTGNELYTAAMFELPLTVVVVDNGCLGMVRQWQELFYKKRYASTILPSRFDFVAFAGVFGVPAVLAETRDQFAAAYDEALAAAGPRLIVARISTADIVSPMVAPGGRLHEFVV